MSSERKAGRRSYIDDGRVQERNTAFHFVEVEQGPRRGVKRSLVTAVDRKRLAEGRGATGPRSPGTDNRRLDALRYGVFHLCRRLAPARSTSFREASPSCEEETATEAGSQRPHARVAGRVRHRRWRLSYRPRPAPLSCSTRGHSVRAVPLGQLYHLSFRASRWRQGIQVGHQSPGRRAR